MSSKLLATHFSYVTYIDLSGKLYKHCYNCFLFGPASFRFSQCPKLSTVLKILKFIFIVQNNKNKKYKNSLVPTHFVTKEVVWFWLDNFDS